jgi:hypothetical protein
VYRLTYIETEYMDKLLISNIDDTYLQDFQIGKSEILNLNISRPMMHSVLTTQKIINGNLQQSVSAQFDPYTLRNHSGYDVVLILHASMDDVINDMVEGHSPIEDIHHAVPNDTEFGFDAPEKTVTHLTHSELLTSMKRTWQKTFPVTISIPEMKTKSLLDAQKTGRIAIQKGDKMGIIEVELQEGR